MDPLNLFPDNKHTPAPYTRLLTTHDMSSSSGDGRAGEPAVGFRAESGPGPWQQVAPDTYFSLIYTAAARPQLNGDADAAAHDALLDSQSLGLTNPSGAVYRMVEFGPRRDPGGETPHFMHRTESLDLGVVLKGEIELHVPGSPPRTLRQGDVCMQRGTMHSWVNPSTTEPARMLFCLLACDPVATPDGTKLEHHLPSAPPGAPIDMETVLAARRT